MELFGRRRGMILSLIAAGILVLSGCEKGGEEEAAPTEEAATEEAAPAEAAPATGGAAFEIGTTFEAITLEGRSGGNVDASVHGDECLGNIAGTPDHAMTVSGPVRARLAVRAVTDTTLVVLGPGGPFCNDDDEGLNPGLVADFAAGAYQVFIGNYSSDEGPTAYTLVVSPAPPEPPPVVEPPVVIPPTTVPAIPAIPAVPAVPAVPGEPPAPAEPAAPAEPVGP